MFATIYYSEFAATDYDDRPTILWHWNIITTRRRRLSVGQDVGSVRCRRRRPESARRKIRFCVPETLARTRARRTPTDAEWRTHILSFFINFFRRVHRYRFVRFIRRFFSVFPPFFPSPFALSSHAFLSAHSDILSVCSCCQRFSTPPPFSSSTVTRLRHSGRPQCE